MFFIESTTHYALNIGVLSFACYPPQSPIRSLCGCQAFKQHQTIVTRTALIKFHEHERDAAYCLNAVSDILCGAMP